MSHHRDEEQEAWAALIHAAFGPEDPVKLDKESHAIRALVGELKTMCGRIAQATGLHETEVAVLARELLSGALTENDAVCSCPIVGRDAWKNPDAEID